MHAKVLKNLQRVLQNVLFNNNNIGQSLKVNYIISLCSFYDNDNMDTETSVELKKLIDNALDYELLDHLIGFLRTNEYHKFNWEPQFQHELKQKVGLHKTFNLNVDLSNIISEIETIRNSINNRSVNISLLISFIAKRAKESGDLNKDVEEND